MRRPVTVLFALFALMHGARGLPPAAATMAPTAVPPTTAPAEPTTAPEPTAATVAEEPAAEPEATDASMAAEEEGVDPAALSGDIYTAGSSTVGPLTEAIIEQFAADGFTGQIKNDIIGSGAGFERFCKTGETDIANACVRSRTAKSRAALSFHRPAPRSPSWLGWMPSPWLSILRTIGSRMSRWSSWASC